MCSLASDDFRFVLFLSCNYIFFMSFFCFFSFVDFLYQDWMDWMGYVGFGVIFWCHRSGRLGLGSFITFMFMFMGYPKPICDFLALSISVSVEVLSYAGKCLMNPFYYTPYIPSVFDQS